MLTDRTLNDQASTKGRLARFACGVHCGRATEYMKTTALGLLLCCCSGMSQQVVAQDTAPAEIRIVLDSEGWQLVGDLLLPSSDRPAPAVLLLNQAAGDRTVYEELARALAARDIASLRLDLRGHGESTNLGRFIPGERPRSPLIWDAEVDVRAGHQYLRSHPRIDGDRIGIVGASYSGEEMAEAGREQGYGQAYVALSPGSFSERSILAIDSSGVPWLFVVSNNERFLREITASLREQSQTVEVVIVPGTEHATNILVGHPDMAERIAVWLAQRLR